jgi:hypothetical protein
MPEVTGKEWLARWMKMTASQVCAELNAAIAEAQPAQSPTIQDLRKRLGAFLWPEGRREDKVFWLAFENGILDLLAEVKTRVHNLEGKVLPAGDVPVTYRGRPIMDEEDVVAEGMTEEERERYQRQVGVNAVYYRIGERHGSRHTDEKWRKRLRDLQDNLPSPFTFPENELLSELYGRVAEAYQSVLGGLEKLLEETA